MGNADEFASILLVCGCWGFGLLLMVVSLGLWVWMLIDCATNEPSEGNDKLIWILVILFTSGIGALIYLIVRRPERIRMYGK